MRTGVFLGSLLLLASCAPEKGDPSRDRRLADARSAAATPYGAPVFDPATLRPGDQVAGLMVERVETARGVDSTWYGDVTFSGPIELDGSVIPHFDSEVRAICFESDSTSAARLPRWPGDVRRPWFCFENDSDAVRALGPAGSARRARILIDRFTSTWHPTDVWNTARLARVIEIAP